MAGAGVAGATITSAAVTRKKHLERWVQAWLYVPLALFGLLAVVWAAIPRWQTLHGTQAAATVQQQLGKQGSSSTGVYHLLVKYQQPQHGTVYARVATTHGTHEELVPGTPVQVSYAPDDRQNALLSSEWSLSGKLIVFTLFCLLLLFTGLHANRKWRSQRPSGYLPRS